MSGICAVWARGNSGAVGSQLASMRRVLSAAGVERGSQRLDGDVGLGVESRFAGQQIFGSDRVVLACDADLLNEVDLRSAVGAEPGVTTAGLLATLYDRDGDNFVDRLRGAFALIVWDRIERRLLAATDGFGIKRLAWTITGSTALVSSRADACQAPAQGLRVNPQAIANLLNFSANLGPDTVFDGVRRVVPGTVLTVDHDGVRARRYWDLAYGHHSGAGEAQLARELETVVEESVAAHSAATQASQIGGFLSGGTDSSTVIGLMTRVRRSQVDAFSIGFAEPGFNELGYAELAARHFNARHHTYLVNARDCLDSLDEVVRCFDEPFGNSSTVATYFCAKLAAERGVTTLLAGDGGDELFGGNERYATDKIFQLYHSVPLPLRRWMIEPVAALPLDVAPLRRARGYIRRANMPGVERMLSFQFLRTHAPAEIFDPGFLEALGDYSILDIPAQHYAAAPAGDHLDRLLYVDMKITLADNDLPKVTRMAELAGVETRFPFLDRQVAEFAGRIPPRLKVKGFKKRYLFKQAFRRLLPAEIVKKQKHGFGIPVALWMKSDPRMRELTRDTLLSTRALGRGYFRRAFIDELMRRHEAPGDIYYGDTLWTFLLLELWHRQVVDVPSRVPA